MISNGAMRTEQAWYTGTNANSEFAAAFIEKYHIQFYQYIRQNDFTVVFFPGDKCRKIF